MIRIGMEVGDSEVGEWQSFHKSLVCNVNGLAYRESLWVLLESFKQNVGGHICLVSEVYRILYRKGRLETWHICTRDLPFSFTHQVIEYLQGAR